MIDKVQKIREEVARIQLYTQSEVLKQVLDYIDEVQKEPVSDIWHDASEPPIIDKTFLLVAPNGNSSLCLWGGKKLHSVTIGGGHSVLCKGDIYSYIDDLLNLDNSCNFGKNLQEESVSEKKCIFTKDSYTYEDRKVLCKDCKEKCEYSKKEEPVSEDLGKVGSLKSLEYYPEKKTTNKTSKGVFDANMPRRKAYLRGFKDGAHAHKELIANKPVSEDLGGYINELSKQFPEVSFAKLSRIAVRVAKWQKQKDDREIKIVRELLADFDKHCDEYHEAGFKHGQEALMKDAVVSLVTDVIIHNDGDEVKYSVAYPIGKRPFNKEDKVKVIVIKEN